MKTSIPCPQCEVPITLDDFEDFSTPFTMKCFDLACKVDDIEFCPYEENTFLKPISDLPNLIDQISNEKSLPL